jgi:stage II sporulation protein D
MIRKTIISFVFLATVLTAQQGPLIRVGLDTKATEWIVSLEGGGEVRSRSGRKLMTLRDGEKLRLWWDSQGEADPTEEYRVQVGPAVSLARADALLARLKALGEAPNRVRVADGDTWRVLTGHFKLLAEAEPILAKLHGRGRRARGGPCTR